MPAFVDFLQGLLTEGSARLREPPQPRAEERGPALELLARAFQEVALDVAGPPIPFDAQVALQAAEFVAWACWFLLHRRDTDDLVRRQLDLPAPGPSAASHLSADQTLRFLPTLHRRARVSNAQDVLTIRLEHTLRTWPLSGVLADLLEPPLTAVDLGQHPGLLLLYAERLAEHPRPGWVVDEVRPTIELVFSQRKLPMPGGRNTP